MFASATSDVQRMASRDGLLLAAGGEGGLAVGHGRLILKPLHQKGWTVMESFVSPKLIDFVTQKITSARCWGHRDPLDAKAEDAGGRG